jgi:putative methionine-R-sulfoxide reductase with GAF domain
MRDSSAGQHLHFVPLMTAVFCVQCELIGENRSLQCQACGSRALLSLSRLLGGSLRGQPATHLIADAELDCLVRDLLKTVPLSTWTGDELEHLPRRQGAAPSRHHARLSRGASLPSLRPAQLASSETAHFSLQPAINVIAERAQALTGATGSAIALRQGNEIVCRARTGRTAPDLGVRLQMNSGISAECVSSGEIVLCNDAERHPRVDVEICRRLGVRSILAAPLRHLRSTLGVFEVLSSSADAFDGRDVATMQLLSSVMVSAIARLSSLRHSRSGSTF